MEQYLHQQRPDHASDDEQKPVGIAGSGAQLLHEFDEQVSPGEKPPQEDGKFLEYDGEHRSGNSCAEGDDKDDSLRLAMDYLFSSIVAEDESDTPEKKPVESAAHREDCESEE